MGQSSSSEQTFQSEKNKREVSVRVRLGNESWLGIVPRTHSVASPKYVHHYIPARFCMDPQLGQHDIDRCREAWLLIKDNRISGSRGRSALVTLFDECYDRLFERSEEFRAFFSGDLRKRGGVLVRILEMLTTCNISTEQNRNEEEIKFYRLGVVHLGMGIRPWMYSVFVEW